jgi:hypothetical protein
MSAICSHIDTITVTELPDEIAGCEDCLASGGTWVHLRMPRATMSRNSSFAAQPVVRA